MLVASACDNPTIGALAVARFRSGPRPPRGFAHLRLRLCCGIYLYSAFTRPYPRAGEVLAWDRCSSVFFAYFVLAFTMPLATLTLALWPTWLVMSLMGLFMVVCLLMILTVLIQRPQGGGLAGAFGSGAGSGQTAFGTKTGDALTWMTVGVFVIFLVIAVVLNAGVKSIVRGASAAPTEAASPASTDGSTSGTTPASEPASEAASEPAPSPTAPQSGPAPSTESPATPAPVSNQPAPAPAPVQTPAQAPAPAQPAPSPAPAPQP
jgi:preprotein translocase subunit SecG